MSHCTPRNRVADLLPTPLAEVDALFHHFLAPSGPRRGGHAAWAAPASVWEADGQIHVEIDAPGVANDGVNVTFDRGQLTIELERRDLRPTDGEQAPPFVYNERGFGQVKRTLALPDTVDPDSIAARLENGVLRVSVSKRPEAQPRRIEVRSN